MHQKVECTATLLSSNVVFTCAHCTKPPDSFQGRSDIRASPMFFMESMGMRDGNDFDERIDSSKGVEKLALEGGFNADLQEMSQGIHGGEDDAKLAEKSIYKIDFQSNETWVGTDTERNDLAILRLERSVPNFNGQIALDPFDEAHDKGLNLTSMNYSDDHHFGLIPATEIGCHILNYDQLHHGWAHDCSVGHRGSGGLLLDSQPGGGSKLLKSISCREVINRDPKTGQVTSSDLSFKNGVNQNLGSDLRDLPKELLTRFTQQKSNDQRAHFNMVPDKQKQGGVE